MVRSIILPHTITEVRTVKNVVFSIAAWGGKHGEVEDLILPGLVPWREKGRKGHSSNRSSTPLDKKGKDNLGVRGMIANETTGRPVG